MLFFSNKAGFQLLKRIYAYRSRWEIDLETKLEIFHNSKDTDSLGKYITLFNNWLLKNMDSKITLKRSPKCMYIGDPIVREWKINIMKGKRLIFSVSEPFKPKK